MFEKFHGETMPRSWLRLTVLLPLRSHPSAATYTHASAPACVVTRTRR